MKLHWAILTNNSSQVTDFLDAMEAGRFPLPLAHLENKKGGHFSKMTLQRFMDEEERHEHRSIGHLSQPLRSLSSGEQKRALLTYIFASDPDYVLLDNPFDNLDAPFVEEFKEMLMAMAERTPLIQITNRQTDVLPFITHYAVLEHDVFQVVPNFSGRGHTAATPLLGHEIPVPLQEPPPPEEPLIAFKNVSVAYGHKPILRGINWHVRPGEFWQLKGPNGSGKSTMLSMITGDNPKAFGQDIYLFGKKKGSGESVWDIKRHIGYFSPIMTEKFNGRHSVEHMLISGLTDSVGLYVQPTETQHRYIQQWLRLLGLIGERNTLFHALPPGNQSMVMMARAMVKHPPLLILDEPTAGLDDASAAFFVQLVNTFAVQSRSAIIFVSHRDEPDLRPNAIFELVPGPMGSEGAIHL
jgi:molybdate transport system ATP-binding protein